MQRAEDEIQKHGNLYNRDRQTDRQTGGIRRNIKKSDSMSRLFIIWKKEKERRRRRKKRKMKVQKGWPYDMPCPQETAIAQNRKLQ